MTAMVRASGIRGYAALMRSLRADPCALLARYGIDAHELDDDENLLSLRSVIHLLEESAALTGCGDFGLRLAERQDVNILGPFGILLQSAETIRLGGNREIGAPIFVDQMIGRANQARRSAVRYRGDGAGPGTIEQAADLLEVRIGANAESDAALVDIRTTPLMKWSKPRACRASTPR